MQQLSYVAASSRENADPLAALAPACRAVNCAISHSTRCKRLPSHFPRYAYQARANGPGRGAGVGTLDGAREGTGAGRVLDDVIETLPIGTEANARLRV